MNSMYFSEEDVKAGWMSKLLEYLCEYSYASGPRDFSHYNDIHIKPEDLGAFTVEWEQLLWSDEYGGNFQFVNEDEVVCKELVLPDRTVVYTPHPEEELAYWLDMNPGWTKDELRGWVHE